MGFFTKDIKTLNDLFMHALQDLYYAENQIARSLPDMIEKASNPQLKQGFQTHLRETENHVKRLEQVFTLTGKKAQGVDCPAIDGIIEETNEILGEVENIGPGITRPLVVTVAPGSYITACKPGMTGDGIQAPFTVTDSGESLEHSGDIARFFPEGSALIEFGSGSSRKVRIVLEAAPTIAAYVPVDISSQMLVQEAEALRRDYPRLALLPVEADFTQPFSLPVAAAGMAHTGFFPGSTIGNFEPHEASSFLRHAGHMLGRGAALIIGVDLVKDAGILNAAYNDAAGLTAKFNLNLLARINRELNGDFELENFGHRAFYNRERHRIEMHLVSKKRQKVSVAGRTVEFRTGETIHTENSYKYTLEYFAALARGSGWTPAATWTDAGANFSIHALTFEDR